jgi:hypothetical protein
MQIDEARPDGELLQQLEDGLANVRERNDWQRVGLATARQVGRDDVDRLCQCGHDLLEHPGRVRRAVQQQQTGLGRLACCEV